MSVMSVSGILFDSGDTLVFPKGGSWWPGPDFHSVLRRHGVPDSSINPNGLNLALAEGEKCLQLSHPIVDCGEEKDVFRAYYRVVCRNLGFADIDDQVIEDLACASV